jgi:hypothetical protein
VTCPGGHPVESQEFVPDENGGAPTASGPAGCLRRCEAHGVVWSNARTRPTLIFLRPSENVPAEVRDGLDQALGRALNEMHRTDKRAKLGYSTSEDAVTWTVFRYVLDRALDALARLAGLSTGEAPQGLLWGVPRSHAGEALREQIVDVLQKVGEHPRSLTEPDVLADYGAAGLVIVEAKYRSKNDRVIEAASFDRYVHGTSAFRDPDGVCESGRYELARNWRLGCDVAGARPFTLINLLVVPESGDEAASTARFAAGLALDTARRFRAATWGELLTELAPLPPWLADYAATRGLRA